MSKNLKPCPFCRSYIKNGITKHEPGCFTQNLQYWGSYDNEQHDRQWNHRPIEDDLIEIIGRYRGYYRHDYCPDDIECDLCDFNSKVDEILKKARGEA